MNHLSYLAILVVVALLVFGALAALVARGGGTSDSPYVAADSLLTPAERSFFGVLQQALTPDYHLFAKVRLADIIELPRGLSGKRRYAAFNCISAKHADFVACDPQTFRIVGVIELDDGSHRAAKRQQRDQFMDSALAAASIPVLRVTAQRSYSAATLREQAEAAFRPNALRTSTGNA
jgi:hypothetical protein